MSPHDRTFRKAPDRGVQDQFRAVCAHVRQLPDVTGVPSGISRSSRRMSMFRNRMQPCEIRPGISEGRFVPWIPTKPPAGQSVTAERAFPERDLEARCDKSIPAESAAWHPAGGAVWEDGHTDLDPQGAAALDAPDDGDDGRGSLRRLCRQPADDTSRVRWGDSCLDCSHNRSVRGRPGHTGSNVCCRHTARRGTTRLGGKRRNLVCPRHVERRNFNGPRHLAGTWITGVRRGEPSERDDAKAGGENGP